MSSIRTVKKVAAYHQYYAVNKAVESVVRACGVRSGILPSPSPSQGQGDLDPEVPLPGGEGFRERENYRGGLITTTLLERVRELRKNQTSAEVVFWELVRSKRFLGLKFRRQHQIGYYITDFYCHEHRLIIELDGGIHNTPKQQEHDRKRTLYLESVGNTVLRFPNRSIFKEPEMVLESIANYIDSTNTAKSTKGHGKGGVLWHTQGSGKSLSMVFLAGKLVVNPQLKNPTIVMLTDRNDLDDQLFDTFSGCQQLLRQEPQVVDGL
jgi:type I restriction enzyme, R subunit